MIVSIDSIYQAKGAIENGTFHGRWHFSFGDYYDPEHMGFGTLRVFNDDTLSPGAVWPLHPHREIEVVTCCAEGEFRHADERGVGGVLKKGWVQHTTVGKGMWHSEINNSPNTHMRFIQMWFLPSAAGLEPHVEQRMVNKDERTNRFLPLVSNIHDDALRISSDAQVFSCFLQEGMKVDHNLLPGHGNYLYLLEGGPLGVDAIDNESPGVEALGAAVIIEEKAIEVEAERDAEILLVEAGL